MVVPLYHSRELFLLKMEVDKCKLFSRKKRCRRQHFSGGVIDGGDSGASENRGSGGRFSDRAFFGRGGGGKYNEIMVKFII